MISWSQGFGGVTGFETTSTQDVDEWVRRLAEENSRRLCSESEDVYFNDKMTQNSG